MLEDGTLEIYFNTVDPATGNAGMRVHSLVQTM
jgi:hypothetical protein